MPRRAAVPTLLVVLAALVPGAGAAPTPRPGADVRAGPVVVVEGRGAAHGMGLAMDGVLGQARAGWSYDRILSLFYPGTTAGTASGGVRVGLAEGPAHVAELPSGGTVSNAPTGGTGPFPITVPPGSRVVVRYADGRYHVDVPGVVTAAQADVVPIGTPPPAPGGPQPAPTPSPSASPGPSPAPDPVGGRPQSSEPIWVVPAGDPGLTRLQATGRRYRGTMEFRFAASTSALWAINHVDLETYVMGIAEEKGQGWPVEALKVLAVAARSLAVSTTTWYAKHHAKGFDICPTGMCQVYLGYDGEEPAMRTATRATAGEIRTFGGRSILAMYHGNGGGQTDTYRLMYGNGVSDPHPYLRSVEYPHAKPSTWARAFTLDEVARRLAAKGARVAGDLQGFEITSTGDSPRVRRLRVLGSAGVTEMTGLAFQAALELPSTWFSPRVADEVPATIEAVAFTPVGATGRPSVPAAVAGRVSPPPAPGGSSTELLAFAALLAAGAVVGVSRGRSRARRSS